MAKKNKKPDDLDTETTFADMNVEGFRWYNPNLKKKNGSKMHRQKITRKEYWQMVRGAFAAYAPFFVIVILVFLLMGAIAWAWVGT